jgi:hypothetical protein
MTEIIIPEKLTETIINIVKRGNVFTKMKKIERLVYGCGILITLFGTSIIMNSFINTRLLLDNNNEQDNYQILIGKQNDKLQHLHYKIDKVIELHNQLIVLLFEKKDCDNRSLHRLNDDSTIYVKSSVPSLSRVTSLSSVTYEQSLVEEDEGVERSMVERSMVEQSMVEQSMVERSMVEQSMVKRSMIDEERAEKH